jgi:hypothetical protein
MRSLKKKDFFINFNTYPHPLLLNNISLNSILSMAKKFDLGFVLETGLISHVRLFHHPNFYHHIVRTLSWLTRIFKIFLFFKNNA